MKQYKTAALAAKIGIHPNTVRLYEDLGLIPKPERLPNGYRVFTDVHLEQLRLARMAFQIEILQNGLRKKIVEAVKTAAAGNYDKALALTEDYLVQLRQEQRNAREAIAITKKLLSGCTEGNQLLLRRHQASEALGITMDTLRNWEMNGLLTVKRKENGYRVYTDEDMNRLKIIRALRCANYSLAAILQMLLRLAQNPNADITNALHTTENGEDIFFVCDKLLSSLSAAKENACQMILMLRDMKRRFS